MLRWYKLKTTELKTPKTQTPDKQIVKKTSFVMANFRQHKLRNDQTPENY